MEGYNGYKNYQTWNVALCIQNDPGIQDLAKANQKAKEPYYSFRNDLRDVWIGEKISIETPDMVAWNDSGLDVVSLNNLIKEL